MNRWLIRHNDKAFDVYEVDTMRMICINMPIILLMEWKGIVSLANESFEKCQLMKAK